MASSFYEQPILNAPYAPPSRHHALDADGQPLDEPPREGRRSSRLITPVPKVKKKQGKSSQTAFVLSDASDLSTAAQEYNPTWVINEVRGHVAGWRGLPNPADWGVTPTTQRLLTHWRHHEFAQQTPFFCQIEADRQRQDHGDGHADAWHTLDAVRSPASKLFSRGFLIVTSGIIIRIASASSRPFARPATGRVAVKVINHFGDEVMKVFSI